MNSSPSRLSTLTLIAAATAALALGACSKADRSAAREDARDTVAQVDQKARELGADAKREAQSVGDKVDDAVITASVKTEIAKDSELSAMNVNVDTNNGHVALRGTAPSAVAKEHASTIAGGVKGVTSVENRLTIDPSKK